MQACEALNRLYPGLDSRGLDGLELALKLLLEKAPREKVKETIKSGFEGAKDKEAGARALARLALIANDLIMPEASRKMAERAVERAKSPEERCAAMAAQCKILIAQGLWVDAWACLGSLAQQVTQAPGALTLDAECQVHSFRSEILRDHLDEILNARILAQPQVMDQVLQPLACAEERGSSVPTELAWDALDLGSSAAILPDLAVPGVIWIANPGFMLRLSQPDSKVTRWDLPTGAVWDLAVSPQFPGFFLLLCERGLMQWSGETGEWILKAQQEPGWGPGKIFVNEAGGLAVQAGIVPAVCRVGGPGWERLVPGDARILCLEQASPSAVLGIKAGFVGELQMDTLKWAGVAELLAPLDGEVLLDWAWDETLTLGQSWAFGPDCFALSFERGAGSFRGASTFLREEGIPPTSVRTAASIRGALWVAGDWGLCSYDPGRRKWSKHALPQDRELPVLDLQVSPMEGLLWVLFEPNRAKGLGVGALYAFRPESGVWNLIH